jgi:hypothetical protein
MLLAWPAAASAQERGATDRKFWLLAGALAGASAADTATTFGVHGRGGRERNPLTRPFIERGPAVTYPAMVAWNVGALALTAKWRRDGKRWWWVPAAALAGTHAACAVANARVPRPPR